MRLRGQEVQSIYPSRIFRQVICRVDVERRAVGFGTMSLDFDDGGVEASMAVGFYGSVIWIGYVFISWAG